jgi:hypothetical protein
MTTQPYTHDNGVTIRRLPSGAFEATVPKDGDERLRSSDGMHWCWDNGAEAVSYRVRLRAAWYAWAAQPTAAEPTPGLVEAVRGFLKTVDTDGVMVAWTHDGHRIYDALAEIDAAPEPEPEPETFKGDVSEWEDGLYKSGDNHRVFVIAGIGFYSFKGRPWTKLDKYESTFTRIGPADPSVMFEGGAS